MTRSDYVIIVQQATDIPVSAASAQAALGGNQLVAEGNDATTHAPV